MPRIAIALVPFLMMFAVTPSLAGPKPNVVFIISDDHDNAHLGFMGNRFAHTPALDRLAGDGAVFTTAHLPMSRCHPTLASFLCGRQPHQSGIYFNYGTTKLSPVNSLPNLLKDAGYATYAEGKFWEGDPREMGFTHGVGKSAQTFVRKDQAKLFEFIDEMSGKQPMFIWWAPLLPHTPHNPPQKYLDLFDTSKMPVPPFVKDPGAAADDGDDDDADAGANPKKPKARKSKSWREKEQLSYAMEAWMDDGVAQLVRKLAAAKQLDNTLFVFVIDNGWCNGLPSKGTAFEKGVRTPVFFTLPGTIRPGQRFDRLISTNDIYPTILDYAGVTVPDTAAGRSLRPMMEGQPRGDPEIVFGATYPAFATKGDERPERDIYAIYARTPKWKYVLYLQDVTQDRSQSYFRIQAIATEFPQRSRGDEDLYDLEADPYERKNLAKDAQQRERMDELKAAALKWWKDTGGKPFDVP